MCVVVVVGVWPVRSSKPCLERPNPHSYYYLLFTLTVEEVVVVVGKGQCIFPNLYLSDFTIACVWPVYFSQCVFE